MDHAQLTELVPVLQVAIGPAILISAVGLLLLTMTNRFGRIIDRSRTLAASLRGGNEEQRAWASAQVDIVWQRARLVRLAIVFGCISALLASTLIMALFAAALLRLEMAWILVTLFASSLATLIASLVMFLQEINHSLVALKLDLFGSR
jgi:uncharacterized protein DUF2721